MNLKSTYLLTIVLGVLCSQTAFAQQQRTAFSEGKPIIKVFANFNSNLGGTDQVLAQDAMEIKRAYLGYKVNIHENYKVEIGFDAGDNNNVGRYDIFLKKAALSYQKGKLGLNVGLISMHQFKVQEKFWGYRYLRKTFQDQYKYNSSADLGFSVKYQLLEMLSLDATFHNGEGYKNIKPSGTFRGGLGATLNYKSLLARVYYDLASKSLQRQSIAGFLGYQFKEIFKIGGEYNYQLNTDFVEGQDKYGYSVYGTYFINDKFELFARYDNSMSSEISAGIFSYPWNINRDEQVALVGLQYNLIRGVKISVNYRRVSPAAELFDAVNWVFLNFEYKY